MSSERLVLGGRLAVARCVGRRAAERALGSEDLWDGRYYALADTPEPWRQVDITDLALRLRFDGDVDRLPPKFTGKNLQSMRTLTSGAAGLLEVAWSKARRRLVLHKAESVEQAMEEFERLGRNQFLESYGFGQARDYFLEWSGRHYDSKAIAGVAYGIENPAIGPLRRDQFSGGKSTVVAQLEKLGFKVVRASPQARNPSWSRDELIVTLDFYFQHAPNIPGKDSSEIGDLSEFLNRLGVKVGSIGNEKFRNRNGVYMKLMNFRRFDPEHSGKGLERGGREDRVVWSRYSSNQEELRALARNIRLASHASIQLKHAFVDEDDEEADEGRLLTRLHRYRERDPKLVKRKKKRILEESGALMCEVCHFDFSESYGYHGEGYIECHHKKALSELSPDEKTRLSDLALVCANCHRMIHHRRPWPTVSDLKKLWDAAHPRES